MISIEGRVWKYGDNVNTDVIFPGKYTYTITDPKEMALHALEDLDSKFAKEVKEKDIIVAGRNFGCGSSREQAAACLKYAGVGAIVAKSFSRIFFRNAINQGLPLVQCEYAADNISSREVITIDFERGELVCEKSTFKFSPLPESVLGILKDGGLIPHIKKTLKIEKGV